MTELSNETQSPQAVQLAYAAPAPRLHRPPVYIIAATLCASFGWLQIRGFGDFDFFDFGYRNFRDFLIWLDEIAALALVISLLVVALMLFRDRRTARRHALLYTALTIAYEAFVCLAAGGHRFWRMSEPPIGAPYHGFPTCADGLAISGAVSTGWKPVVR